MKRNPFLHRPGGSLVFLLGLLSLVSLPPHHFFFFCRLDFSISRFIFPVGG